MLETSQQRDELLAAFPPDPTLFLAGSLGFASGSPGRAGTAPVCSERPPCAVHRHSLAAPSWIKSLGALSSAYGNEKRAWKFSSSGITANNVVKFIPSSTPLFYQLFLARAVPDKTKDSLDNPSLLRVPLKVTLLRVC